MSAIVVYALPAAAINPPLGTKESGGYVGEPVILPSRQHQARPLPSSTRHQLENSGHDRIFYAKSILFQAATFAQAAHRRVISRQPAH